MRFHTTESGGKLKIKTCEEFKTLTKMVLENYLGLFIHMRNTKIDNYSSSRIGHVLLYPTNWNIQQLLEMI